MSTTQQKIDALNVEKAEIAAKITDLNVQKDRYNTNANQALIDSNFYTSLIPPIEEDISQLQVQDSILDEIIAQIDNQN